MSISITNIILFLGAAQGILLAVLIFHKHGSLFANHFLCSLMFFYSIILLNLLFNELGYYQTYPHLILIPLGIPFIIGPLHYLYAKYLIHSAVKTEKTDWLHFIPFLLYELYLLPDYFIPGKEIIAYVQNIKIEGLPSYYLIFNWIMVIHVLVYMILTISAINQYSRAIKNVFSTIEKIKLDWLRKITYMAIIILMIFLIENIFLLCGINLSDFFDLTSLLFSVSIYIMGYIGLSKSEIFSEPEIAESISRLPKSAGQTGMKNQGDFQKAGQRYEKSGLSADRAKFYLEKLIALMKTEKPYTNNNLTIHQLADMLSISAHNLSEIINTQLNQNFFDFVNQYRVEKVKQDLVDPGKQHLKLLAIAFDAGFNSKTAFNTIFKKHTGMTPSGYRSSCFEKG